MSRISVILPSRNERFLPETVNDVLAKAKGDIEIIPVLDGYTLDVPLSDDPRVKPVHIPVGEGMRPAICHGAAAATGDYIMKLDAHCMVDEGFDMKLLTHMQDDWLVIPRRYSLDPINWSIKNTGKSPVDAHFLSYPFELDRPGHGLHGTVWNERARNRKTILIDDEMSSQGSCWFTKHTYFDRILNPMDVANYGSFINEFQEVGCKIWLSGGRVVINKHTWYAHLHKGKEFGRGYFIDKREFGRGSRYCIWFWMTNQQFPGQIRDFKWLIEKFWPVPTWPTTSSGAPDWDRIVAETEQYRMLYEDPRRNTNDMIMGI